jgi:signal transduction histidine kinase
MQKHKILVIEDESALRSGIEDFLSEEGYQVYTAENGRIGLAIAKEVVPDLIICDVMMPEMSGYETLALIRSYPPTATIPFIFLTAKSTISDMRAGMALGADDYLTKPFTIDTLLQTVQAKFEKYDLIRSQLLLAQQKEITKAIVEAQEAERFTIASDIHDGLGQILTAALLNLETLKEMDMARANPILKNFIPKMEELLNSAYEEARNIMYNLSPSILEQNGLYAAIENLCFNANACGETEIEFICETNLGRFNHVTEITIYRIIQEALNNVLKYARAQKTTIALSFQNQSLRLEIKDDGMGFDYEQAKNQKREKGGRGLKNIENRVRLLGGILQVDTAPGKGTHYTITIPSAPVQR